CPASVALAAPPDFNGVWARFPDPYADGPFPDDPPPPEGGPRLREPYATAYKQYQKRKKDSEAQGKPLLDASTQCLPRVCRPSWEPFTTSRFCRCPRRWSYLPSFSLRRGAS